MRKCRAQGKNTAVQVAQKVTRLLFEKIACIKSCTKHNKLKALLIQCHTLLSKKCFLEKKLHCIVNQLLLYD